jgi:hypothetical protein
MFDAPVASRVEVIFQPTMLPDDVLWRIMYSEIPRPDVIDLTHL